MIIVCAVLGLRHCSRLAGPITGGLRGEITQGMDALRRSQWRYNQVVEALEAQLYLGQRTEEQG
jgi:hypothetical protein